VSDTTAPFSWRRLIGFPVLRPAGRRVY
jgi:hypothetical protein